nr:hypothetical protein [Serratia marcescens]
MVTNNERQDSPELVLKAVADSLSTSLRVAMPASSSLSTLTR